MEAAELLQDKDEETVAVLKIYKILHQHISVCLSVLLCSGRPLSVCKKPSNVCSRRCIVHNSLAERPSIGI